MKQVDAHGELPSAHEGCCQSCAYIRLDPIKRFADDVFPTRIGMGATYCNDKSCPCHTAPQPKVSDWEEIKDHISICNGCVICHPLRQLLVSGREASNLIKRELSFLSPDIERKILGITNEFAADGAIIPLRDNIRNLIRTERTKAYEEGTIYGRSALTPLGEKEARNTLLTTLIERARGMMKVCPNHNPEERVECYGYDETHNAALNTLVAEMEALRDKRDE